MTAVAGPVRSLAGKAPGRRGLGLLGASLLAFVLLAALLALPAAADVRPAEVSEYRKDFGVSSPRAEATLELQDEAIEVGLVDRLEATLGADYAGVYLDNESGEIVVPVLDSGARADVGKSLASVDLEDDYRTVSADSSWADLEAAQRKINAALQPLFEKGLAQTSLDPRANVVRVTLAVGVDPSSLAEIRKLAASAAVEVVVEQTELASLEGELDACGEAFCGSPLRGGAKIFSPQEPNRYCSAGFRAYGNNGARYVLTAGHCAGEYTGGLMLQWSSKDENGTSRAIGEIQQYQYPAADWARIAANGSWWDISPWPAEVVYWGTPILSGGSQVGKTPLVNEHYPITGEGRSMVGNYVCHSGATTGTTCGTVTAVGVTHSWGGLAVNFLNEATGVCSDGGDSGGPVFAANTALGMLSGSTPEVCNDTMWYRDIVDATAALGVTVAPRVGATVEATSLNGNPGWATVRGTVTTTGGTPVNGNVNIRMFKWENNAWAEKAVLPTTVTNGNFEIANWNGVGPGQWVAQAVFPAQGNYSEAKSDSGKEGWFTVKDGYRLVAQHSGRCLDVRDANKENGAMMQQGGCTNPAVGLNQVFKLVPQANNYNLLVARHSNRCVDVNGESTADGALVIQHVCKATGQNDNQLWKLVAVGGGFYELRAKHSGKCMDVTNAAMGDYAQIQQWTCNGFQQQHWQFQSVDSALAPADVFITVPEGEVLNGQPGFVTAYGYVKAGAYPLAGRKVHVNFQKWVNNEWATLSSAELTLNSEGYYNQPAWQVGAGSWRVRTVMPGGAPLAESASPYKYFEIKRGYLFVFRNSNLCMSLHGNLPDPGTPILQWHCGSPPNPALGQVFTIVPRNNGYHYIKINSTGQCLSVHGALQAQGTPVLQWPCQGGTNQEWQIVPIAGQAPWFAMIARHSGQCGDMKNASPGTVLTQWGCTWVGSQQWKFIPVD